MLQEVCFGLFFEERKKDEHLFFKDSIFCMSLLHFNKAELVIKLPKGGPEDKRLPKPNNISFLNIRKNIQVPYLKATFLSLPPAFSK